MISRNSDSTISLVYWIFQSATQSTPITIHHHPFSFAIYAPHPTSAGPTKNWIAVEGSQSQGGFGGGGGGGTTSTDCATTATMQQYSCKIASSAPRGPDTCTEDRNVFAIYVSYYIKVKLTLSAMGGEVTLKLPFILGHVEDNHPHGSASHRTPDKGHSITEPAATTTTPAMFDVKAIANDPQSPSRPIVGRRASDKTPQTNVLADAEPTATHCPCQPAGNSQPSAATLDDIIVEVATTTTAAAKTSDVSEASAEHHACYFKGDAATNEPQICNVVMAQVHSSAN